MLKTWLVRPSVRDWMLSPSAKFKNNYSFFQTVMLAYNIWRYMKIMAQMSTKSSTSEAKVFKDVMTNTIRIARLKLLFIAAKVVKDSNQDKVKYSIHDARTPPMMKFLEFLDAVRSKPRPWANDSTRSQHFALQLS
jgi:hypothetical protein